MAYVNCRQHLEIFSEISRESLIFQKRFPVADIALKECEI